MTPLEARTYLDSFINYEFNLSEVNPECFKLERIKKLLEYLGDPQKNLKIIHIAGSVGKGSTALFTASILQKAGYKVGLYTSPHLRDYTERIRVLDSNNFQNVSPSAFEGEISEQELCDLVKAAYAGIEKVKNESSCGRLTFFEVYTALAIFHFYRQGIDFAVLETGLGGRLDATNVVDSLVCAITPINFEHTNILGSTLKEISQEKAAIIKNEKQIVVVAPQPEKAQEVIRRRCEETGAECLGLNKDFVYKKTAAGINSQKFTVEIFEKEKIDLETFLLGEHQVVNATTAVGIIESLKEFGCRISPDAIVEGVKSAFWPGRIEIMQKNPLIILDGAHNPYSCEVLISSIKKMFSQKKVNVVLGVCSDKDIKGICNEINKIAYKVILTKANHPRRWDFSSENLEELFSGKKVFTSENIQEAIEVALKETDIDDIILITGSLFVVGEARDPGRLCTS